MKGKESDYFIGDVGAGEMGLASALYRLRWKLFVFLVLCYTVAITVYVLPQVRRDAPVVAPQHQRRASPHFLFYFILFYLF
jgi:hypothetical protein